MTRTEVHRQLSEAEWREVLAVAQREADDPYRSPTSLVCDTAVAVLAAVGIVQPPPEPDREEGTCTAMYPNDRGEWEQCGQEPHHDNDGTQHDNGEWSWNDSHHLAVLPTYPNEDDQETSK